MLQLKLNTKNFVIKIVNNKPDTCMYGTYIGDAVKLSGIIKYEYDF